MLKESISFLDLDESGYYIGNIIFYPIENRVNENLISYLR